MLIFNGMPEIISEQGYGDDPLSLECKENSLEFYKELISRHPRRRTGENKFGGGWYTYGNGNSLRHGAYYGN